MKNKINFDEYIVNTVKKNDDVSIRVLIHNDKFKFNTLMNWLAPRGYTWKEGQSIFSFSPYQENQKCDFVNIFPSEGIVTYGVYEYNTPCAKYCVDIDELDLDVEELNHFPLDVEGLKHYPIVYISGAISGTDDYMERFENAEKDLLSRGYTVINPAKINSFLPTTTTWEQYMEIDYKILDTCDTIYMLNDWNKSRGAKAEHEYAKEHGLHIMYQPNELRLEDASSPFKDEIKFGYDVECGSVVINGKHCITLYDAKRLHDWLEEIIDGVQTDDI